tara:strand:- start:380 stop:736 length:357 start_codon:yes stop_codon:yes gene_type:complete
MKLQEMLHFDATHFADVANESGNFSETGAVVLDERKWTTIMTDYNKSAISPPLDVKEALALLDGEASSWLGFGNMSTVTIGGIVIFVIFCLLIFMKRSSNKTSSSRGPRRPPPVGENE